MCIRDRRCADHAGFGVGHEHRQAVGGEHAERHVLPGRCLLYTSVNELIDEAGYAKVRAIVPGGAERVDSTLAALDLLKQAGIPSGAKIRCV